MVRMIFALLVVGASVTPFNDAAQEQAIHLAKMTVGREAGVSEGQIHLDRALPFQWSGADLECSPKAVGTAQSLIEGYRVTLRAKEMSYAVHVGGGRAVVCERVASGQKPADTYFEAAARLSDLARRDLASRLNVAGQQIDVSFIRPTTWPDASLGCPEPEMNYAQMLTKGFLIELRSGGRPYQYHADTTRVVLCEKLPPEQIR